MDKYRERLNQLWDRKERKMDWLGMESMLVDILRDAELTDREKVKLTKECIDAYTRRGHFPELWERPVL